MLYVLPSELKVRSSDGQRGEKNLSRLAIIRVQRETKDTK